MQVDDGAPFRITRLAGKVRTHASSLLSLCNENEWCCLIVGYSAYHFLLGLQAAVDLGRDMDVSSASKSFCDFSKILTLVVVTISNLARLRMIKGGLGDNNAISRLCHGVIEFITKMHAILVEYQSK